MNGTSDVEWRWPCCRSPAFFSVVIACRGNGWGAGRTGSSPRSSWAAPAVPRHGLRGGGAHGALVASTARDPLGVPGSETYLFVQFAVAKIFGVYALRMAAVFLLCQATAWLRHGLMPRWLALPTYAVALVLLVVVAEQSWAVLVFPGWIFVISAYLFVASRRMPEAAEAPPAGVRAV